MFFSTPHLIHRAAQQRPRYLFVRAISISFFTPYIPSTDDICMFESGSEDAGYTLHTERSIYHVVVTEVAACFFSSGSLARERESTTAREPNIDQAGLGIHHLNQKPWSSLSCNPSFLKKMDYLFIYIYISFSRSEFSFFGRYRP